MSGTTLGCRCGERGPYLLPIPVDITTVGSAWRGQVDIKTS